MEHAMSLVKLTSAADNKPIIVNLRYVVLAVDWGPGSKVVIRETNETQSSEFFFREKIADILKLQSDRFR
jgi:hypothetical protein